MSQKKWIALAISQVMLAMATQGAEQSAAGPEYTERVNEFLEGATLSALAVVDTRWKRNSAFQGDGYHDDLNYSDYNLIMHFASGYTGDDYGVGVDLGGFFQGSLYSETNACSEVSACIGWDKDPNNNGAFRMHRAALKYKMGALRGDVGLTQMGIGTLGDVWSFEPGTYRGGKVYADLANLTLGYAFVDRHWSPWADNIENSPDGRLNYHYIQTAELTTELAAVALKLGIGMASLKEVYAEDKDDSNYSYQLALDYWGDNDLYLGYDFYGVDSEVEYDGLAGVHGVKFAMPIGNLQWSSQLQYTHIKDPSWAGVDGMAARPVFAAYGTNAGTYSLWWDAISDFNQNQELAWFNQLHHDFDNGFFANLGLVYAHIGDNDAQFDRELAANANVGYSLPSGPLKDSSLRLHLAYLDRHVTGSLPDWFAESTYDIRFQVFVPYNFL